MHHCPNSTASCILCLLPGTTGQMALSHTNCPSHILAVAALGGYCWQEFIPTITGKPAPNDIIRALWALPVRLGGLSVLNPTATADAKYESSIPVTAPLVALIVAHEKTLGDSQAHQRTIRKEIWSEKRKSTKKQQKRYSSSFHRI